MKKMDTLAKDSAMVEGRRIKKLLFSAGVNNFVLIAGSHQATGAFAFHFLGVYRFQKDLESQITVFFSRFGKTRLISGKLSDPTLLFQFFSSTHKMVVKTWHRPEGAGVNRVFWLTKWYIYLANGGIDLTLLVIAGTPMYPTFLGVSGTGYLRHFEQLVKNVFCIAINISGK
jgi:hypothetical protein